MASSTAYVNGRVITMDDALSYASGLITEAGRVVAIGGDRLAENVADTVDLAGRPVIPGFVDAHCHLETFATHLTYAGQCFVPPHRSISDIAAYHPGRPKVLILDEAVAPLDVSM